jgi:hypothetical protein
MGTLVRMRPTGTRLRELRSSMSSTLLDYARLGLTLTWSSLLGQPKRLSSWRRERRIAASSKPSSG